MASGQSGRRASRLIPFRRGQAVEPHRYGADKDRVAVADGFAQQPLDPRLGEASLPSARPAGRPLATQPEGSSVICRPALPLPGPHHG